MSEKENKIAELFERILDHGKEMIPFSQLPERGQFVLSGLMAGRDYTFENAVGYPVQIRKKRGSFGTDQYFIRHSDGSICVHENQFFFVIKDEFKDEIKEHFAYTIDDELDNLKYFTKDKDDEEDGYIIEATADQPIKNGFVVVATTVSK